MKQSDGHIVGMPKLAPNSQQQSCATGCARSTGKTERSSSPWRETTGLSTESGKHALLWFAWTSVCAMDFETRVLIHVEGGVCLCGYSAGSACALRSVLNPQVKLTVRRFEIEFDGRLVEHPLRTPSGW